MASVRRRRGLVQGTTISAYGRWYGCTLGCLGCCSSGAGDRNQFPLFHTGPGVGRRHICLFFWSGIGGTFFFAEDSQVQMSNVEPNVQTDFKFFSWVASNFQENVSEIEKIRNLVVNNQCLLQHDRHRKESRS